MLPTRRKRLPVKVTRIVSQRGGTVRGVSSLGMDGLF
jgi:hypothetical protein